MNMHVSLEHIPMCTHAVELVLDASTHSSVRRLRLRMWFACLRGIGPRFGVTPLSERASPLISVLHSALPDRGGDMIALASREGRKVGRFASLARVNLLIRDSIRLDALEAGA